MIQLAALFSDGAVLQRDQPLAIWGWAPPRTHVQVTLGPHTGHGISSARGRFEVWLPALPAGGPHTLTVCALAHPGMPAATARDLLVGEVWLASGQSNMEWTLAQCGERGIEAIASAHDPELRFFTVVKAAHLGAQDDVEGAWQPASPGMAPEFSAVAYHFAARLRRELGVPVGVIVSAWGGTPIEAWLSRQAQARSPHLALSTAAYACYAHSEERWIRATDSTGQQNPRRLPVDPGRSDASADWEKPTLDDQAWAVIALPSTWQRQGHRCSGVFWFRRTVELPAAWIGHDLVVELGAADKHDITYVQGVEIGRTGTDFEEQHWNRPRRYTVPGRLVTSACLNLAVRVYSFLYDGGLIGPAEAMRVTCPGRPGDAPLALAGDWRYAAEHDFGYVPGDFDPGHLTPRSPHILHDNMIAPLAPFALRGVAWYQGENNVAHASRYADLLRDLVDDWRRLWGRGDFPFFIVQIAPFLHPTAFDPECPRARLREAQREVAQTVPGTALIVTLDVGDATDIHPTNKAPIGHRLAQAALVGVHGRPGVLGCPLPMRAERAGSRVAIYFTQSESGLRTIDGNPVQTLRLRAPSGQWHAARGAIDGPVLQVSAADCAEPVEVAYAWADNPQGANLVNREGFPVSPFRLNCERSPT